MKKLTLTLCMGFIMLFISCDKTQIDSAFERASWELSPETSGLISFEKRKFIGYIPASFVNNSIQFVNVEKDSHLFLKFGSMPSVTTQFKVVDYAKPQLAADEATIAITVDKDDPQNPKLKAGDYLSAGNDNRMMEFSVEGTNVIRVNFLAVRLRRFTGVIGGALDSSYATGRMFVEK